MITEKEIWDVLDDVKDPEIPKVSVVDMGIVTGVEVDEEGYVKVKMTPTFAGCPAVDYMKNDIKEKVSRLPVSGLDVEVSFDVQWSTNMITEKGRRLLKESQFALPPKHNGLVQIEMLEKVECPFCGSKNTILQSPFGPTQCRAIHYCKNCLQAFEQFKPV
ncbi:MAG TPA: phenylacetate-CoA oxygenase subunit PaaJ [Ignavibacteria bacterium]|nr:phenylacetate-CoA oxygenase subunit PaaJ [Ignavibacteria bacterium]HMR39366.1 phenylacetate-CoA oxygenase subunit PaaJ [Ignavibacteria bacterium]